MSDLTVVTTTTVTPTTASTSTARDVVAETRNHLYRGQREQLDKLAVGMIATGDQVTTTHSRDGISANARISIDLEDMLVWSVSGTPKVATVERGQFGSTPAAHDAGALIYVNPKWSDAEIFRAINDELAALSSEGMFQMRSIDLSWSPSVQGYDLTGVTDLLEIYEIRWKQQGPSKYWPTIRNYTVSRNMATTEFASGTALLLMEGATPGATLRVRYKAPFGRLQGLGDNIVATSGLPATAIDILPLGAGARLVAGREIKRNLTEHQGDTRRAGEVPPGANLGSARELLRLRQQRLDAEVRRLHSMYPTSTR